MRKDRIRVILWSSLLIVICLIAIIGPKLAPFDPLKTDLYAANLPPSRMNLMGTDYVGRDIFSRLLMGASRSIFGAMIVVVITFIIGTTIGLIAGYYGGIFDGVLSHIIESVQAFPSLIITIAIAGMLGPGFVNTMIAMSAVGWTSYARLARSETMEVKQKDYVLADRISGYSRWHILWHTVFPNIIKPLIVTASMHIGHAILSFAGLSFLGLGTTLPYPEWGSMLNEARDRLQQAPWATLFPGLAIVLVVMVFGLLGDSLNRYFNRKRS